MSVVSHITCSYKLTYIFITVKTIILTGVSIMTSNKIKIYKKTDVRGEDGYKTFSVRIKEETVTELEDLATRSNRSRNELINILLEHAVKNVQIME